MSKVYRLMSETLQSISLNEAFPYLQRIPQTISFVGGGGKSTLMYTLAAFTASRGLKTLVTTSTHIWEPEADVLVSTEQKLQALWKNNHYAVVGKKGENHKLAMPDKLVLDQYSSLADIVLIEADGAKGFPCKVPKDTEPVILPQTDVVIGVFGIDAIGQPLREVCFRLEEAKKVLNVDENHVMTEEDVVRILTCVQGTKKAVEDRQYMIVLNKCDNTVCLETGKRILTMLKSQGESNAVLTSLL